MTASTYSAQVAAVDGRRDPPPPAPFRVASPVVVRLAYLLAALASITSTTGLFAAGGSGRHQATTARGEVVTLFGEGLYAADSWLVGAGNRGQDVAVLLVEVPALLFVIAWYRRGSPVAATVLTGVLSFFGYYYVSMVFGTAQNRLFPVYVAAASTAGFALMAVARQVDSERVVAALTARPGRRALMTYLGCVAAALGLAWLPGMVSTSLTGKVAEAVGPYTSGATEALDLGVVVPVAVLAVVLLQRSNPAGRVLALVMLVMNVCIGVVLVAQGAAQLTYGVPLTMAEVVGKSLTFLVLTLVAGSLLLSMSRPGTHRTATRMPRLVALPRRARRVIGGFYLAMGGVHLGIVAADPQLYRHFADDALLGVVRDQWAAIVMANPAFWGMLLFGGETVIGMLLLSSKVVAVRVGWTLVIAFHVLLVLFGAGALVWSLPVLAVVIPLARRDWPVEEPPSTL